MSTSIKKIGIIAALPFEIDILKKALSNCHIDTIGKQKYYQGTIEKYEVVFMQCGMGKVSAASGAQAMITAYHPDIIINTGCAGALSKDLDVGDLVLATNTIEWDLDTIDLGNPRGFVSSVGIVSMDTNKDLTNELEKVINSNKENKLYKGLIVSGDQFVSHKEQRDLILKEFPDALCCEMEGAAIGHVCYENSVPFAVIRCMSDNANGDSGVSFAEFAPIAGEKSASIILKFLKDCK